MKCGYNMLKKLQKNLIYAYIYMIHLYDNTFQGSPDFWPNVKMSH